MGEKGKDKGAGKGKVARALEMAKQVYGNPYAMDPMAQMYMQHQHMQMMHMQQMYMLSQAYAMPDPMQIQMPQMLAQKGKAGEKGKGKKGKGRGKTADKGEKLEGTFAGKLKFGRGTGR